MQTLSIVLGGDAVVISVDDDAAKFTGAPTAFMRLAREVALFAEYNDLDSPGMHAHFDPGAGVLADDVLARDSRSLIIAGPVPDDD